MRKEKELAKENVDEIHVMILGAMVSASKLPSGRKPKLTESTEQGPSEKVPVAFRHGTVEPWMGLVATRGYVFQTAVEV